MTHYPDRVMPEFPNPTFSTSGFSYGTKVPCSDPSFSSELKSLKLLGSGVGNTKKPQ